MGAFRSLCTLILVNTTQWYIELQRLDEAVGIPSSSIWGLGYSRRAAPFFLPSNSEFKLHLNSAVTNWNSESEFEYFDGWIYSDTGDLRSDSECFVRVITLVRSIKWYYIILVSLVISWTIYIIDQCKSASLIKLCQCILYVSNHTFVLTHLCRWWICWGASCLDVPFHCSIVPLFCCFLCFLCLTHLVSLSCYNMYLAYLVCTENIETFHSFVLPWFQVMGPT